MIDLIDQALTGHLGVDSTYEIDTPPYMDTHELIGVFSLGLGYLQHSQPWRNYQNVKFLEIFLKNTILNLKTNTIPKGMVELECIFDHDKSALNRSVTQEKGIK